MATTLITGANEGLGHQTARELIALGHTGNVATRHPALGPQAAGEKGRCGTWDQTANKAGCDSAV